jgi:hypothetical protein
MTIEIEKHESRDHREWLIHKDGHHIGEIVRELEDYASATSRARGTKVEGYSVWFDADGKYNGYFPVARYDNARAALSAAKAYAIRTAAVHPI